jgi:hypothetical protein
MVVDYLMAIEMLNDFPIEGGFVVSEVSPPFANELQLYFKKHQILMKAIFSV